MFFFYMFRHLLSVPEDFITVSTTFSSKMAIMVIEAQRIPEGFITKGAFDTMQLIDTVL